jgi:hypothetical protein
MQCISYSSKCTIQLTINDLLYKKHKKTRGPQFESCHSTMSKVCSRALLWYNGTKIHVHFADINVSRVGLLF